jgi:hypothetical protein
MRPNPVWSAVSALVLFASVVAAQGPDVIVGDLNGIDSYGNGGSGTIYAYAVGTTACNIGNQVLGWWATTNQHPVIGQNIFRLKGGRFEQIGMSWLKNGTGSGAGSLCGACQPSGSSQLLGVLCSDPYGASTNGNQATLSPRSEVNASTGYFPFPGGNPPWSGVLARRIQLQANDVNPATNAGAVYFAEAQYVSADDAAAGHQNNNASYRSVTFAAGSFNASLTGGTVQTLPAINAWGAADPTVVLQQVDFANDGRFFIARKATSLGGGNFHFEFAIQNLNSDRSGRGFTVVFPAGTVITNPGFKDIAYHSGEPFSGTDWTPAITGNSINWATELHSVNPNANALRWGTLYNFWCDATAAAETSKTIEPFKPEPCAPNPVITPSQTYAFDPAAPFDNPASGGASGPSGDDASMNVPIGFAFTFYGSSYTSLWMSTNGFVTFAATDADAWINACIPASGTPNGLIASYWDDLLVDPGETTWQTIGAAPNRRFVLSWTNVGLWASPTTLQTFKIILDETTNKITSTIVSSAGGGAAATRGIERQDGLAGVQGSCDQSGSAVAGTSWTWTPSSQILPSASLTVTGSAGPNGIITLGVNSNASLAPVVLVASLDPGPTDLGPLGVISLGLTPGAYAVLADGAGALQPADPADVTDSYCGDFTMAIPVGPAGLPPGLTIYIQGVVFGPSSVPPPPNGAFHITDMEVLTT